MPFEVIVPGRDVQPIEVSTAEAPAKAANPTDKEEE